MLRKQTLADDKLWKFEKKKAGGDELADTEYDAFDTDPASDAG